MRVSRGPVAVLFDPGWLYLLPGLALVASAVLIPSHERLEEVRWQRARAETLGAHLHDTLQRHRRYVEALEQGGETVLLSLAASQLNMVPEGTAPMVAGPAGSGASVFDALEPPPPALPEREAAESRLRRIAMSPRTRPWLIAAGLLAVFIGLLPRAQNRRDLEEREDGEAQIRTGLAAARAQAEALWQSRGDAALAAVAEADEEEVEEWVDEEEADEEEADEDEPAAFAPHEGDTEDPDDDPQEDDVSEDEEDEGAGDGNDDQWEEEEVEDEEGEWEDAAADAEEPALEADDDDPRADPEEAPGQWRERLFD